MLLHFYFPFKAFPENERERESAHVRERRRSSPRSRAPAPVRRRDRWRDRDCDLGSRSPCRDHDRVVDRDRSVIAVSDRDRAVVPWSRSRHDRDLGSRRDWLHFWNWWFFFSRLWLVFSDLCFPSSFPNTRKYFPKNFLKCNQTYGNIFLFRKLAFPENMYFLENVLQQPNTT